VPAAVSVFAVVDDGRLAAVWLVESWRSAAPAEHASRSTARGRERRLEKRVRKSVR
jgi:hypothetical protein